MRDGWIEATLGDLISYSIGGIWGDDPGNSEIDVPIYRQTEFNDSGILTTPADAFRSITKSQLKSRKIIYGDILIQKSAGTPTLPGRVVMVPDLKNEVATFSNFLNLLRPDETKCIPRFAFLYFWFLHHIGRAYEFQRGTNIKNLDLPNYLEETIFLPPLNQQKRIVDLISSVDSYIEALQQQLETAKRSRNAVLHELLTAGGDDWVESSLGVQMSLEYGKPLTESNRDGIGFPVYGSAGIVGMHSEPLVSTAPVIIVGRKGTAGAVYWSEEQCFVIDTAYFVALKTDIELKFLYHLLNFVDLKSVTAQTGVPGLNRDRAYSLKCKIPPKSKQFEIVEMISTMDEVVNKTESILAETQNLRSGLLSDLLSGEHEIPASYDKVIGAA
jgi:type I restriction enzyme S subunit